MKIRPVGAELSHADGRTDTMKLIVAFRNFADAPKKREKYMLCLLIKCHRSGSYMRNLTPQLPYSRRLPFEYQPGVSSLVITLSTS
jgi:hypothetical protein